MHLADDFNKKTTYEQTFFSRIMFTVQYSHILWNFMTWIEA